ncbi:hypothetical protein JQK87_00950 [Streptomyces sp. G44]|uniref:hypothetical protein n=1 Tax=Streptomyces sp. G44 TaxID=2807632 RepID=UPI001960EE13|nr:hypothetical protein [Streptomyces sp. G44]MBM7167014.1 hypothetical protein [Streptomyces sp. G44]
MRASAVLTAVGLATAGLMAALPATAQATAATSAATARTVAASAAAAPHSEGPALMLMAQETADCLGLPAETTAVDRGVRGLALIRLGHIPVTAPPTTLTQCLDQAARDDDNPIRELAAKHGDLLGLKSDTANNNNDGRPPREWLRPTPVNSHANPDAHLRTSADEPVPPDPSAPSTPPAPEASPGTTENPPVAIVDTVISKVCTDVPITVERNTVGLVGAEVRNILTAQRNQRCADGFSPYGEYEPLLALIDKLPPLSEKDQKDQKDQKEPREQREEKERLEREKEAARLEDSKRPMNT